MTSGKPPLLWRMGWLVFLVLPLGRLLDQRASAGRVAVVVAGAAVFLGLYVALALRSPWGDLPPWFIPALAVQLVIAVALTLFDQPDWGIAFIYLAGTLGVRWGPRPVVAVASLCLVCVLAAGGGGGALGYATPALGVGILMVIIGRLRTANLALDAAREELAERAVSEERARFARDLHDLLGHSLSVIAIKAELAGRLAEREPAATAGHVREIEEVAREALAEVRDAVGGYRRPTLAGELAGARMALDAAGVRARVQDRTSSLAEEAEAVLA